MSFYKIHLLACIILVNLFLEQAKPFKHYNCVFDQLHNNPDKPRPVVEGKPDEVYTEEHLKGRGLQATTRNPIRITLDTTDFNSIKTGLNGAANTNSTKLQFIKRTMLVVEQFYEKRLKVSTIARIFSPSSCNGYSPSSNDVNYGISSSDLHIYVRYLTDKNIAYGATGVACKFVTSMTTPDLTFQQGRPTIGIIIFNTYHLVDL